MAEEYQTFVTHTNEQFDRLAREIARVFEAHNEKFDTLATDNAARDDSILLMQRQTQRQEIQHADLSTVVQGHEANFKSLNVLVTAVATEVGAKQSQFVTKEYLDESSR